MLKLLAIAAVATLIVIASDSSQREPVSDLWAIDAEGRVASLKGFTSQTRVYTREEHKRLDARLQAAFSNSKFFCNREFLLSDVQIRWLGEHARAKHRVVLRERLPQGRHRDVC